MYIYIYIYIYIYMSSGLYALLRFTENYVSTKVSYSHITRIVQYFVTAQNGIVLPSDHVNLLS